MCECLKLDRFHTQKRINWSDLPDRLRERGFVEGKLSALEGRVQADESQLSVNENRRSRREEADSEREVERSDGKPSWRKRVDLPIFEGLDQLNWFRFGGYRRLLVPVLEVQSQEPFLAKPEGSNDNKVWRQEQGTIFERLATTKEVGAMDEYVQDFEVLAGQMKGVLEDRLFGYFLVGLQEDIKIQVQPHDTH